MNTVKHLNSLKSQPLQKKSYLYWTNSFLPVFFLSSLMGTLNDLYLVQRGWFEFPARPMPELFSFNILFTFGVLPAFVFLYIMFMERINKVGKIGLSVLMSILLTILEKAAELYGLLVHAQTWNHMYSFFVFMVCLLVNYYFYLWLEKQKKIK